MELAGKRTMSPSAGKDCAIFNDSELALGDVLDLRATQARGVISENN
jgi:hypothetical protein